MSDGDVQPGQVWTRRSDGSRVVVESIDREWDDVTYRRLYATGKRSRKQQIFASKLWAKYDLTTPAPRDAHEPAAGSAAGGEA